MIDLLKLLVSLQAADTRILEKRRFIDKVPRRIFEVDEPLKLARTELETIIQKNEAMQKKKRDKEKLLEEVNEKIKKMKARVSDIKTNKEYQAHLKEIESFEAEISGIEEAILIIMEDLDVSLKAQQEKEAKVKAETEKINAFKKELEEEVRQYESELLGLKEERDNLVKGIDQDTYALYMKLLGSGGGIAVTSAKNDICSGCNMNLPPQLFVEIRKNEEIHQCLQCHRILFYAEEP